MNSEIIINSNPEETRVALLEFDQLVELYIERKKDISLVGNIYKAKVIKVLPGMQSAFVNIGFVKASFLHPADVYSTVDYSVFPSSSLSSCSARCLCSSFSFCSLMS